MLVKLHQIKDSYEPLKKLVNSEMPVKIAFRIGRLAKKIQEIFQDITDHRNVLIRKYGTAIEDEPGSFRVEPDRFGEFQAELGELLEEEVEIDFVPIDLSILGDKVQLTPREMLLLEPFFFLED